MEPSQTMKCTVSFFHPMATWPSFTARALLVSRVHVEETLSALNIRLTILHLPSSSALTYTCSALDGRPSGYTTSLLTHLLTLPIA